MRIRTARLSAAFVSGVLLLLGRPGFGATISIMPLGDSITAGTSPGGYRAPLVNALTARGFMVTTVGTQIDTSMATAVKYYEGHPGWRIDQLAGNLTGYVNVDSSADGGYWLIGGNGTGRGSENPNYVCVMAGINDIDSFYGNATASSPMSLPANINTMMTTLESREANLINTFALTDPSTKIMLSNCIPYANPLLTTSMDGATDAQRAIWAAQDGVNAAQEYGVNHYVILFNKWLQDTFVPQEQLAGKHVYFVDQYDNFILPDGSVRGWDNTEPQNSNGPAGYSDYGLHPNQFGYNLMGATWANAIAATVPEPGALGLVSALVMACLSRWRRVQA